MNSGAVIIRLDRRRLLQRACELLVGLLLGMPSLASRPGPRRGPPEAAFYRPLRPPQEGA